MARGVRLDPCRKQENLASGDANIVTDNINIPMAVGLPGGLVLTRHTRITNATSQSRKSHLFPLPNPAKRSGPPEQLLHTNWILPRKISIRQSVTITDQPFLELRPLKGRRSSGETLHPLLHSVWVAFQVTVRHCIRRGNNYEVYGAMTPTSNPVARPRAATIAQIGFMATGLHHRRLLRTAALHEMQVQRPSTPG